MQPGAVKRVVVNGIERAAGGQLASISEKVVMQKITETMNRIEQ
jgi:hypothetical protein